MMMKRPINKIPDCKMNKIVFKKYWVDYVDGQWEEFDYVLYTVERGGICSFETPVKKDTFEADAVEAEWFLNSMLECINSENSHPITVYNNTCYKSWLHFENGEVIEIAGIYAVGDDGKMNTLQIFERFWGRCESRWMGKKIGQELEK